MCQKKWKNFPGILAYTFLKYSSGNFDEFLDKFRSNLWETTKKIIQNDFEKISKP